MYNAALEIIAVTPQGREELAFSYAKPSDWQSVEIPHEEPNFEDPKYFLPVAVATALYGIGVFSVGVRPAFDDGTVREWLEWLCGEDQIQIEDLREVSVGPMRGYIFDARQKVGVGTMVMRNLYVEDGGRLFAVCAMAAEQIFASMQYILAEMTESFRLAHAEGPTAALAPIETPAPPVDHDRQDNGAGAASPTPLNPGNAGHRTVAAASLDAQLQIPSGWRLLDDGRRALVFQPDADAHIHMDRRARDGATDAEILDAIQQSYERQFSGIESLRLELGGCQALAFRSFEIDAEPVEQVFLVRPTPQARQVMVTRVTSPDGGMADVLDAAAIMLTGVDFGLSRAA
ncbi:MAG TPA: hypothetical protein VFQ91_09475 [Bryobacteraceae bacterium]|nr:hypothetical protein [Bryobacteraceae bacterium]